MKKMRSLQVALVLLSLTALGQAQKPTLVPAPLELQPNPALKKFEEPLRAAFLETLRDKAGVLVPTRKEVEQAFLDGKRQDCRESNECLSSLATRAGTLYALFVEVSYTERKELVVSGRVVRDDGKLISTQSVREEKGKETILDVSRRLFIKLFEQLGLSKLPTFKEAAVVTPPDPDPIKVKVVPPGENLPPPPPPPAVEASVNGGRVVGWIAVGVGAAVGIAGVISFATAPVIRREPNGNIVAADASKLPATQFQQGLGVGLMAGGFGVAIAGAVMVAISKDAESVKTTVVPMPGGAVVLVGGVF